MLAVLTVLFIVFGFPSFAFAVDYSIEEMLIEVQLEENGDAKVIETQTYTFDSDFNGITRTLYVKEGSSIQEDRKSTRLNSSHVAISYAVICMKKKNARQKQ